MNEFVNPRRTSLHFCLFFSMYYLYNNMDRKYQAWNLWNEGRALELIDETLNTSCPASEFIQCMHIALLCTQGHAVDRPTMSTVVLMLTSETDLPQPKAPFFFQSFLNLDLRPQSSSSLSVNDVSVSVVEPR